MVDLGGNISFVPLTLYPSVALSVYLYSLLPSSFTWLLSDTLLPFVPCWALLAGWWSSPCGRIEGEVLSECTAHYQHSYRFFSHLQVECWQVWTGRQKESVSLPQVREPSLVTHLCFTVSVSLAVFVLVSLACECYCCSWEYFK